MAAHLAGAAARPALARPKLTASLAAFAAFFGLVATNALTAQSGRHAHPLMATRPGTAADVSVADETAPGLSVPLVVEVQMALAEAGYDELTVDGRPGPDTAAAIRRFQQDHGLTVDGEATPRLLAALRGTAEEAAADDRRIASLDGVETGTASDAQSTSDSAAAPVGEHASRDLVRRVQEGLNSAKVAELAADGLMGSRTEAAIRSFQALQGLPVTGVPDETVLSRLKAVVAARR